MSSASMSALPGLHVFFKKALSVAVLGGDRRPQDVHSSWKLVVGDVVSPSPLHTPSFLEAIFIHHLPACFPNTFIELKSLISFPSVHTATFHCILAMWLYLERCSALTFFYNNVKASASSHFQSLRHEEKLSQVVFALLKC